MSEKGRSSDADREAEIRGEIEKRVFQESRARTEKKRRAQEEQIEVEALAEVSELSPEEIERISREVRDEHRSSTDSEAQADAAPRGGRRFLARAVPLVLVVVAVGAVFAIVASYVAKDRRSRAEAEAARKYFALLDGLEKGNAQMVQYLLDQGAPLQTPAGRGYGPADSALMAAAAADQVAFVRLLLARGADVAMKEERNGWTALDFAEHRRNAALVRLLGEALAEASPPGSPIRRLWATDIAFSRYGFVERVKNNDLETVRLFLSGGMDVNAQGRSDKNEDQPAIAHAARAGHVEMVRLLLSEANPGNKPDTRKALEYAVRWERADVVRLLLERGADPNGVPVYDALANLDIATLLLDYGADVNASGAHSQVPALLRVLNRWETVTDDATRKRWVRFLLDRGANVSLRGGGIVSALELARNWGDAEVVQWISDAAARQ